jgi:hypothetical protein
VDSILVALNTEKLPDVVNTVMNFPVSYNFWTSWGSVKILKMVAVSWR